VPNRILAAIASIALLSCAEPEMPEFHQCLLEATFSVEEGPPGTTVLATGGEFSVDYDTTVLVDGAPAEILEVQRINCAFCDGCRDSIEPPCNACEECEGCTVSCEECEQTVSFVIPEVPPGEVSVVLMNRFGASGPLPFTVTEPAPAP